MKRRKVFFLSLWGKRGSQGFSSQHDPAFQSPWLRRGPKQMEGPWGSGSSTCPAVPASLVLLLQPSYCSLQDEVERVGSVWVRECSLLASWEVNTWGMGPQLQQSPSFPAPAPAGTFARFVLEMHGILAQNGWAWFPLLHIVVLRSPNCGGCSLFSMLCRVLLSGYTAWRQVQIQASVKNAWVVFSWKPLQTALTCL